MTLDDAIKHCYERAEELREKDECLECAHEHEELAGWLEELKERRANDRPHGKWIYHKNWYRDGEYPWKCSECGTDSDNDMNFCGECGADMRGDEV